MCPIFIAKHQYQPVGLFPCIARVYKPLLYIIHWTTTITATILWLLYRSTCVSSRQLQLSTGWFCWCNQHIRIRKMLEFSSTVSSTLSPYHYIHWTNSLNTETRKPRFLMNMKWMTLCACTQVKSRNNMLSFLRPLTTWHCYVISSKLNRPWWSSTCCQVFKCNPSNICAAFCEI